MAAFFHHALKFRKEVCIGCSHCMNVCPTEAIRIKRGKAELIDDRCIDCGKCYMVCPVGAIIVEQDDFNHIFDYEHRVALIPNVLPGQFPPGVSVAQICSVLMEMGFTHIFEVEHGARILKEAMTGAVNNKDIRGPLISTFCPAIVRLIQVRFPMFTDNLLLYKAPLDIAAMYYRQKLVDEGADPEQTGVFYITPCPAKIAAIKSPVGEATSPITGVINMDFIYNKLYTKVKQGLSGKKCCALPAIQSLNPDEVLWTLTDGEAANMPGRALAIDEVNNVIEFLEKLENEEISDIDFLELRACDQSCAGGILTSGNRFFTVERLGKRAGELANGDERVIRDTSGASIMDHASSLRGRLKVDQIRPRAMDKLDEDMGVAMEKMKKVQEIRKDLPNVDCGVCGSPTCNALAEDIVQGTAAIDRCIYVQKRLEQEGQMEAEESLAIMKDIWGAEKFSGSAKKTEPQDKETL